MTVTKSQVKVNSKSAPPVQSTKSSVGKTKTKKEEAVVMKLFEQTKPRSDEFFQWCTKVLSNMQSELDSEFFNAIFCLLLIQFVDLPIIIT